MKRRKIQAHKRECETEYWRKAAKGVRLTDYPNVDEATVTFPDEIFVAYAVSPKCCGRNEFIVDGSTQLCHYCGKTMFRIVSKKYVLASDNTQINR